ncbi:L-seryl-tRNA(Sec) kinase-like [Actinia tenebrosa]|uniref:L-seryl-tRNA(Sec) kinase-like n=1 Tax=Actinia tenebrosa TaxID=6105 RepID=A0A6P8HCU4_ACTTE|nr:L-seryl-tRNA(Sec) kinase-like [Actinia tenebrosa]
MADNQKNINPVLMILCGIPASGKTHLANSMKKWSRRCKEDKVHVLHICYDELIPVNLDLQTSSLNDQKEDLEFDDLHSSASISAWKHYRKLIIQCVERIAQQIQDITFDLNEENDVVKNTFELPSFQDFWKTFYEQTARKDMSCACLSSQKWIHTAHILLVDDNMYYRSMRHEYFLLARKYGLGYMQVFIECPVNTALDRNSQRGNPIDRNTIVTMATKLEPPSPDKYPWEEYSMVLDANDDGTNSYLTRLLSLMAEAALNPVQPLPEENKEEKEEARAANLTSMMHQADQTLRKVITDKMAKAKGDGFTKQEMRSLAEELNLRRKTFLDKLKTEESLFQPLDNNVGQKSVKPI